VHCQAGTPGAEFHPALDQAPIRQVFSKGDDARREAYSAFDGTGLTEWLRNHGVRRLLVCGLATDYCVRASVLDALADGFEVAVLEDGIGAVEVQRGDGERALAEMRQAGATVTRSDSVG
jgi:nicotinamidase-related amidase